VPPRRSSSGEGADTSTPTGAHDDEGTAGLEQPQGPRPLRAHKKPAGRQHINVRHFGDDDLASLDDDDGVD